MGEKIKIDLSALIKDLKPKPLDKPKIGGLVLETCPHCGKMLPGLATGICPHCHKRMEVEYG